MYVYIVYPEVYSIMTYNVLTFKSIGVIHNICHILGKTVTFDLKYRSYYAKKKKKKRVIQPPQEVQHSKKLSSLMLIKYFLGWGAWGLSRLSDRLDFSSGCDLRSWDRAPQNSRSADVCLFLSLALSAPPPQVCLHVHERACMHIPSCVLSLK